MARLLAMADLKAKLKEVQSQIATREETDKRVAKLRTLVRNNGFERGDFLIVFSDKKPRAARKKKGNGKTLPMKFFHPTDKTLAWSGKARPPAWLVALEKSGTKRDKLMTKPDYKKAAPATAKK